MILGWSCIGDVEMLDPTGDPDTNDRAVWQLSFNDGHDRAPRWLPGSDTIFYSANTAGIERGAPRVAPAGGIEVDPTFSVLPGGLPFGEGVLLALTPKRGPARPLIPALYEGLIEPLTVASASLSIDGAKIAYTAPAFNLAIELACSAVWASCLRPGDVYRPTPIVRQISVYVRERMAVGPQTEDRGVHIQLGGIATQTLPPGDTLIGDPEETTGWHYEVRYFPFHAVVRSDELLHFGPSWSPTGDRIAFSDGHSLRIWHLENDNVAVVPGTQGGIAPAWSPSGEWIAYTALVGGEPDGPYSCDLRAGYDSISPLRCVTEHWYYPVQSRQLRLTSPDGAINLALGPGVDPAWSADGSTLFFVRSSYIWARDMLTETERQIPDTRFGREPAPSPDGAYLAFSRRTEGAYNIWVTLLNR